jgi:hypothetical protein
VAYRHAVDGLELGTEVGGEFWHTAVRGGIKGLYSIMGHMCAFKKLGSGLGFMNSWVLGSRIP